MNEGREDAGRGRPSVEEEEPTPLNSFHPRMLDWVIQKALEIKHYAGVTWEGFEDEFLVLLTAVEAGSAQLKADPSLNLVKKR